MNEALTEEIDARFLRSMLYEPLPGSAVVILAQLGIIEEGQTEALGARTYDAESARLSLALDDGRTVELERAMHLHTENGYAVRIRSRAGQTISRSFIHIDRDLGVRNLHNDRMVYIDDAGYASDIEGSATEDLDNAELSEAEIEASADLAHESQHFDFHSHSTHFQPQPGSSAETLDAVVASATEEPVTAQPPSTDLGPVSESTAPPNELSNEASSIYELPAAPGPSASASPQAHTEMLEIFPAADVTALIYFHESLIPTPGEIPNPEAASHAAPPEAFMAEGSLPEPSAEAQAPAEPDASQAITAIEEPSSGPEPAANPALEPITTPDLDPASAKPEVHPDYVPLHAALTPAEAADFLFIAQTGTIHTYEHRQTFRYIHIDAPSGLFYDQSRTPISRIAALKRAFTPKADPTDAIATSEPSLVFSAAAETDAAHSPQSAPPSSAAAPATAVPYEPELRVRTTYAARAEVRPEPAPESQLTRSDQAPSFDAFTRKHGSPLDRDSWRDRVAGLSRALRLGRNANSSNSSNGDQNS